MKLRHLFTGTTAGEHLSVPARAHETTNDERVDLPSRFTERASHYVNKGITFPESQELPSQRHAPRS